ncbi:aminoglycoside 3'-O-phosphotransferase [Bifidobacterium animalis subsp. lactis]|uniref:Aminoglycoside 3'-O-phosphotransferase n=2 Tax=Bifidobacterium animalis TaxID=28025 RepID=A0A8B3RLY4_BIFAN|nr:aminoglycoside 3'-O-phosphotransferase [Bifidobacterium animalis subsp. lactis]
MRAGPRLRARSGGLRVYLSACIPVTPTPTDPFRKHMQRTPIESIPKLPAQLRQYTAGRRLYDSSSSPEARVYALSSGSRENARPDLFLKTAAAGSLAHEARMDDTFHMLGLGPEVVEYLLGKANRRRIGCSHARFAAKTAPRNNTSTIPSGYATHPPPGCGNSTSCRAPNMSRSRRSPFPMCSQTISQCRTRHAYRTLRRAILRPFAE